MTAPGFNRRPFRTELVLDTWKASIYSEAFTPDAMAKHFNLVDQYLLDVRLKRSERGPNAVLIAAVLGDSKAQPSIDLI